MKNTSFGASSKSTCRRYASSGKNKGKWYIKYHPSRTRRFASVRVDSSCKFTETIRNLECGHGAQSKRTQPMILCSCWAKAWPVHRMDCSRRLTALYWRRLSRMAVWLVVLPRVMHLMYGSSKLYSSADGFTAGPGQQRRGNGFWLV